MAQQIINIGTYSNDGTGDPARVAFAKCNNNFSDFYSGLIAYPNYTVANLPTSVPIGARAFISDGNAPTFLASPAGGGTTFAPVFFNGAAWVVG